MKKKSLSKFLRFITARTPVQTLLALTIVAAGIAAAGALRVFAREGVAMQSVDSPETAPQVYLPAIIDNYPEENIFGIDMISITPGAKLDAVDQAGFSFIRKSGLFWADVESTKGTYNWGAAADLENELVTAKENGFHVVLLVQLTPGWAQKYRNTPCGPMKSDYFDEFGAFLAAAVQRYSGHPYFVKYFEIWNEPDIDPDLVPKDALYGCWGDDGDSYYGGRYYGEMLKTVYPMMKAVNPDVEVVVGGLLLNCDPRNPPAGQSCKPSKFLEGILVTGAKNSFDGVSFHSYDYFSPDLNIFGNSNWSVSAVQPSMISKISFIQETLAKYAAQGKFLMDTELAMICDSCSIASTSPYEIVKKAYATQAYVTTFSYPDMKATMWYSLEGWRGSGLLTGSTPRPVYYAIDFAQNMLTYATFIEKTNIPNVTGYKFVTPEGKNLWVLWTTAGDARVVTLGAAPIAVWDAIGDAQPLNGADVNLTIEPVYIEMP